MIEALQSKRITVRPFQSDDASAFRDAVLESLETVGKWLPWCRAGYSVEDASAWIKECSRNLESMSAYDLGIFSATSGRLLGGISINQINKRYKLGNIGYWIRQSEQGQGIATESVQLMIPHGFDVLGLNRLEIAVLEQNQPSRTVAEKVGAVFEGIARNRLIKDERPCDAAIYSLIPETIANA